jgi:hypothetical protein
MGLQKVKELEPEANSSEMVSADFEPEDVNISALPSLLAPATVSPLDASRFKTWELYGLNHNDSSRRPDGLFELVKRDGKCFLSVPEVFAPPSDFAAKRTSVLSPAGPPQTWAPDPLYVGFNFDQCPFVIETLSQKQLKLVGMNPTISALPTTLQAHFENGRWLAMSSHSNLLHLLDNDFETIAATRIHIKGFENTFMPKDSHAFNLNFQKPHPVKLEEIFNSDPRLFTKNDGTLVLSSVPYNLMEIPELYPRNQSNSFSWWDAELFAPLHVTTVVGKTGKVVLKAWTDREEWRSLQACPEEDKKLGFDNAFKSDSAMKNSALMQAPGQDVYVVDWVYPPNVGKFDLESPAVPGRYEEHFHGSCFRYTAGPKLQDESVFGQGYTADMNASKKPAYNHPSGGPAMIWLNESQQFLGVGHFHKGFGESPMNALYHQVTWGHHYTYAFYTYNKEPPFRMTNLGTEFCFASVWDPEGKDCDIVQFISGMQRDGDNLAITYGVRDSLGFAAKISLTTALASLRPVESRGIAGDVVAA